MVKVSVIIPVYNTEKFLPSCLNSVLNQTIDYYEIIVVNDNSTDNSLKILNYYKSKYPYKLKVINLDKNHGVSYARNLGLKNAQGEYIYFMDSDDVVSLNFLNDFYNLAKLHDLDIVEGNSFRILSSEFINNYQFFSNGNRPPKEVDYSKSQNFFHESPGVWTRLFRHDFIDGIDFIEGKVFEDIAYIYPLLLKANGVYEWFRDDYAYRYTPNSIMESSYKVNPKLLDIIDICLYSNELGNKFKLDEYQLKLLENVNKLFLTKKMNQIKFWKGLSDSEKRKLLQDYANICYTIFGNFNKFDFTSLQDSVNEWTKDIAKYIENSSSLEHLEFEKNNLSRRLVKLSM